MRLAETVTFGGSALDRAAELRAVPEDLAKLAARPGARAIVLWRGKPLLQTGADGTRALARLPLDHALVQSALPDRILLGREAGEGVWSVDISGWEPADLDAEAIGAFLDPTEQKHPDAPENTGFAELRAIMTHLSPRDCELAATAKAVMNWHGSHGFCAKCGAASDIAMAGWQRNCPACGTHHFPRTDPVVIMLITHGNDVLLGRSPGWPQGMYSLLAGFVEPGETLEAAVRREVVEEAGVSVGTVSYLACQPWPFPASLMFGYRGEALSREITIDPVEIEDALWVSRERMAQIFAGADPDITPPRKGAIAQFILWHWLSDELD